MIRLPQLAHRASAAASTRRAASPSLAMVDLPLLAGTFAISATSPPTSRARSAGESSRARSPARSSSSSASASCSRRARGLDPQPLPAPARHDRRRALRPSRSSPGSSFRDTFIFFGILHHIAVASVLGLALPAPADPARGRRRDRLLSRATAPCRPGSSTARRCSGSGSASTLPRTNDFVPLFPWFGVVLAGIAAARLWPLYEASACSLQRFARSASPSAAPLAGRHSLVDLPAAPADALRPGLPRVADLPAGLPRVSRPPTWRPAAPPASNPRSSRTSAERDLRLRRPKRSQAEGLWSDLMRQTLTASSEQRYFDSSTSAAAAAECTAIRQGRLAHSARALTKLSRARDWRGAGAGQRMRAARLTAGVSRETRGAAGTSTSGGISMRIAIGLSAALLALSAAFPSPPSLPWKWIPAWARSTPT